MNQIELKKIEFNDIYRLKSWTNYDNPLFLGYNYNSLTEKEAEYWYLVKQKKFRSSYFSINYKNQMIGFIGIKEINKFRKTAKLGIVLDKKFTSQGFGSISLKKFLDYYFLDLNMNALTLEVNAWNKRAINLYKKFGFYKYKEKFQEFENQDIDLEDERFSDIRKFFIYKYNIIFSKVYFMRLKRREYIDEV